MQIRFLESLNPVSGNSITGIRRISPTAASNFYRKPTPGFSAFRRYLILVRFNRTQRAHLIILRPSQSEMKVKQPRTIHCFIQSHTFPRISRDRKHRTSTTPYWHSNVSSSEYNSHWQIAQFIQPPPDRKHIVWIFERRSCIWSIEAKVLFVRHRCLNWKTTSDYNFHTTPLCESGHLCSLPVET